MLKSFFLVGLPLKGAYYMRLRLSLGVRARSSGSDRQNATFTLEEPPEAFTQKKSRRRPSWSHATTDNAERWSAAFGFRSVLLGCGSGGYFHVHSNLHR